MIRELWIIRRWLEAGGKKIRVEMRGLFARQLKGYRDAAVPKAAMMRGGIPQNAEVMQQGAESLFVQVVGVGDGLKQRTRRVSNTSPEFTGGF